MDIQAMIEVVRFLFTIFVSRFYDSLKIFIALRIFCALGKKSGIFKCEPGNLKAALALEIRLNEPKISSRSATKSKGTLLETNSFLKCAPGTFGRTWTWNLALSIPEISVKCATICRLAGKTMRWNNTLWIKWGLYLYVWIIFAQFCKGMEIWT